VFERYTEPARHVVVLAQEEARLMRHQHIGTEHLLAGIARLEDDAAAGVLHGRGLTAERTRAEVVRHVPVGEYEHSGPVPFTAAATEALEVALREALGLGHATIRPGHLLLAVLRQRDGVARRLLRDTGADVRDVQEEIVEALAAGGEPPPRPRSDAPLAEVHGPVPVSLGPDLIGDLGNPRVDAQLLLAILERGGPVAAWLRERGLEEADVRRWSGLV
jgi:ATP-dependent Clp protease ATP-binding subunit ClpA